MPVYQSQTRDEKSLDPPNRARRRQMQREWAQMSHDALQTGIRQGVLNMGVALALTQLTERMEDEANHIAGAPKGKHRKDRTGKRHGYANGYVIVGGAKMSLPRPRVRSLFNDHELKLPSYEWAQSPTALDEAALRMMVLGVATRSYKAAVDTLAPLSENLRVQGVSKSAVSRRFVTATQAAARELMCRSLSNTRYLVLYLDGVEEGGHHVLVAMGLTQSGEKEILGLWEGSSENATVARELLEDVQARGLDASRGLLIVLDGGKALSSAVKEVFGERVQIQRCQVHKERNVAGKLPQSEQAAVKQAMRNAWNAESASQAQADLEALADRLHHQGRHEAAASLREGLRQTLTCLKLDVDPVLMPSLTNTNPLESIFSVHEACAHRVKRWRNGRQVVRWVAMGLLGAEASFARIEASDALQRLAERLERDAGPFVALETSAAA